MFSKKTSSASKLRIHSPAALPCRLALGKTILPHAALHTIMCSAARPLTAHCLTTVRYLVYLTDLSPEQQTSPTSHLAGTGKPFFSQSQLCCRALLLYPLAQGAAACEVYWFGCQWQKKRVVVAVVVVVEVAEGGAPPASCAYIYICIPHSKQQTKSSQHRRS